MSEVRKVLTDPAEKAIYDQAYRHGYAKSNHHYALEFEDERNRTLAMAGCIRGMRDRNADAKTDLLFLRSRFLAPNSANDNQPKVLS